MKEQLRSYILGKQHFQFRKSSGIDFGADFAARNLPDRARVAERFVKLCALETPVFMPDEEIVFTRTMVDKNAIFIKEEGKDRIDLPTIYTVDEWKQVKNEHFIHEAGFLSNVVPDYGAILDHGLLYFREKADEYGKMMIDALIDLADRYAAEARNLGKNDIAEVLKRVPRYSATSFREALQLLRICNFAIWLEGNYHVIQGRFDQYCGKFLENDLKDGKITEERALELLCDYFLALNKDTDLYFSIQRGDNGQSITLGGVDKDGKPVFNALSRLCLLASKELKVIDPKINIRADKNTPIDIYRIGSELTAVGLGFPQYTNDDTVIAGLLEKGYELEDARNYCIAACWEIIVPIVGADVINVGALSFAKIVDNVFHNVLPTAQSFDELFAAIEGLVNKESRAIVERIQNLWFIPSPFYGLFFPVPDISKGGKYNNLGMHGTGISTASDSLAAIKKYVFDEKSISPAEYIAAVDANFVGYDDLLAKLRYNSPKMGNDDDFVDSIAIRLMDCFSKALKPLRSCRGGQVRAGTGSAMYYLWHAEEIGASPDGRRKGEGLGTNYSPSLFAQCKGPLSIVKSFTKPELKNIANGGPLTLEFLSNTFDNPEGVEKLAQLVRMFVQLGGHQVQLNTVDAGVLRDAQKNPEKYPQLVVRIWGWSAYFVELDKAYQDHVIARTEYAL